jgi:hypothetical protein
MSGYSGAQRAEAQGARAEAGQIANTDEAFREHAYTARVAAARTNHDAPIPPHPVNDDETKYPNLIGSDSRGLPHDQRGEVDPAAFKAALKPMPPASRQISRQFRSAARENSSIRSVRCRSA